MEENVIDPAVGEEKMISLREFLTECLRGWKWFLLSIFIFCAIGMLYVMRQQPIYALNMEILVKNEENNASITSISNAFSSFGLGGGSTNVRNEVIALSSPALMYEVVDRLGLQMNYEEEGIMHNRVQYGPNQPYVVTIDGLEIEQNAGFKFKPLENGKAQLYDFYIIDQEKVEFEEEVISDLKGSPARTPIGRVVINPNPDYKAPKPSRFVKQEKKIKPIVVTRLGRQSAMEFYGSQVEVDLTDKDADVIKLTIGDQSRIRGRDILNTIVDVYNEIWMEDKNKIARATSAFIDDRLKVIEQELGEVDSNIADYQSQNAIPDLKAAAEMHLRQQGELGSKILEVNNQLSMAQYVKDYISNPINNSNVLPVNTGMGSVQLETQIANYNTLLMNRNTIVANSSEQNPLALDYDAQLRGMRESILKGVNTQVAVLQAEVRNMEKARSANNSQLSTTPIQAKHLLTAGRQQTVKESLYLYLLERREENELSQAFTATNTRIITPPEGSRMPVSPKKNMVLMMCLMIGFAFPAIWIYIATISDTKVRSRKDLENMATPFAGEIPQIGKRNKQGLFKRLSAQKGFNNSKKSKLETALITVKQGSRDMASESFRIIRGNIDFMMRNHDGSNVIMLTSFNPGSGKSFIGVNLAASFALKGKKVLIVDTDLRHGSTSQFINMPSRGLTNYLNGSTDDWRQYVKELKDHPGVCILPIGHRPPNPSELLDNGRFGDLIKEAATDYDYVFLDCPPVDIVVDTQIVEKYADRTLFVIRAGVLDKKAVIEVDDIYKSQRFKQMSVILNGTDSQHSRHSTYGSYGYYGSE
ncbi:MAG: polysaccharide biosynthesis tyrosine autokinase [Muribaculaceae bacterium]|nr:polysaccharide biosynthesis tyrosine autokinase [Muribaculaceae bacterium]